MTVSDWIAVVTPWPIAIVLLCYVISILFSKAVAETLFDEDNAFSVSSAVTAVIAALVVSLPVTRPWLLPRLTTMTIWLTVLASVVVVVLCWLVLYKKLTTNEALERVSLVLLGAGVVVGLDAFLVGSIRWLVVDIVLRITDWGLVASPFVWFIVMSALAIQAISDEGWRPKDWSGNLLFKLSALVGSLLCLALVLDMHLHRPPITDLIFDPPHVWWTFAGSTVFLIIVYWLYRPTMLEEEPDKDRIICSSLLGGFFLPGALNALLIGIYYIIK